MEFEDGRHFQIQRGDSTMVVKVVGSDEQHVTFDGNHPLAGKDLIFDIELVEVKA